MARFPLKFKWSSDWLSDLLYIKDSKQRGSLRTFIDELRSRNFDFKPSQLKKAAYLADFPLLLELFRGGLELDSVLAVDIFQRSSQEDKYLFANHVLESNVELTPDLIAFYFEFGGASMSLLRRLLAKVTQVRFLSGSSHSQSLSSAHLGGSLTSQVSSNRWVYLMILARCELGYQDG